MSIVTLTTDFGTSDWFVGTMKGVILGINPRAHIVDITHEIAGGDIRGGAFALAAACRYFPSGTVHVVVVDPGVGSQRKAIVARTADAYFVGPDNGVLSLALASQKVRSVRRLENDRYFLHPVSRTFHGRDVFAPVAACLSRGMDVRKLGPVTKEFVHLDWPLPKWHAGGIRGEVVHIDRFGNAITNIDEAQLGELDRPLRVRLGRRVIPVEEFYQAVKPGQPVAVAGSSGFLEIAINSGSAADRLKLKLGSRIEVQTSGGRSV